MHKNTERGFNMDTTKKLEMLKRLDDIYEAALKNDDKAKVQDVIKPYLGEFAKEYDVDEVDIFIDYMDHVARSSKKIANSDGEDRQIEIDFNSLDNINLN